MRTRTAKKLAQRIDLNYFKRSHGLRRLRMLLSIAAPALGLLWLGSMAAAGSRAPYSSGPVSSAHAFAENKCEVCHQRDDSFRAHVKDSSCLTCHAGPVHVSIGGSTRHEGPACGTCHREHNGRLRLAAAVPDGMCVECHGELRSGPLPPRPSASITSSYPLKPAPLRPGPWPTVNTVKAFPSEHPEFAVLREEFKDPGGVRFNHQLHSKDNLRGPNGPEKLECISCHWPELTPTRGAAKRVNNLMATVKFDQQCARCHPLFFDARIATAAPHNHPKVVWASVEKALRDYITDNPKAISERDQLDRRLPLNFPREPEPLARNADEWVQKRSMRARVYLTRVCSYCHGTPVHVDGEVGYDGMWPAANMRTQWMGRATFDHAPHLMVQCSSCHNAEQSRETSDVLMPSKTTCVTCHAPGKGASAQCIECHGYHDWTKAQPVKPHFKLTDFQ